MTCGTEEMTKIERVLRRESQKSFCLNTSVKFWKPTKSPWPCRSCHRCTET